jgi:serine phosphatase RsbU (regulator of sigma subunit)
MLPGVFPPFPKRTEFDIYALMEPAKEVGGDFYDFFFIDESKLAVVMADVSGNKPGLMPGFMEGIKYEQDEIEMKSGAVR